MSLRWSDVFLPQHAPATPPARDQQQHDYQAPQDANARRQGPPLPDTPGEAQAALDAALAGVHADLDSLQRKLGEVAAILLASKPQDDVYETLYLDTTTGRTLDRRGRRYVGIRNDSGTSYTVQFQTPTGNMAVTVTTSFAYFKLQPMTRAIAQTTAASFELVYTDDIGGAIPN